MMADNEKGESELNINNYPREFTQTLSEDNRILFYFIEPKKIIDVATTLRLNNKDLSAKISRPDRNTTYLARGFLEKTTYNGRSGFWKTTPLGIAHLDNLKQLWEENLERKKIDEIKKKEFNEKVVNYRDLIQADPDLYSHLQEADITKHFKFPLSKILNDSPEDYEDFLDNPDQEIKALGVAIEQFDLYKPKDIKIEFVDVPKTSKIGLGEIRTEHCDKFVYIEGMIRQATAPRHKISEITFECPACGTTTKKLQTEKHIVSPRTCHACGRKGEQKPIENKKRDFQVIVLEEHNDTLEGRTQVADVSCLLSDHFTQKHLQKYYNPGSSIRIAGIVRDEHKSSSRSTKSVEMIRYLEVLHIEPFEAAKNFQVTDAEREECSKLAKEDGFRKKLIDSFAPEIYGYDEIKEALLCQLAGGHLVKNQRSNINILLIGDPGIAKTKLAENILDLIPNTKKVFGANTTAAGLTAATQKDELTGEWGVVAGALPLCNNSSCLIDELDKVEGRNALAQPLENQAVTTTKAGVAGVTMEAKTAVLATANPKNSYFDPSQDMMQQIKIEGWLMSRFDLVFAMIDTTEKDEEKAEHILNAAVDISNHKKSDLFERDFIRKYISVARKIKPVADAKVVRYFAQYYSKLRGKRTTQSLNARQLVGFMRLATANAKLRLSDKVENQDAEFSINIALSALRSVVGDADISAMISGMNTEKRSTMNAIQKIMPDKGLIFLRIFAVS